MWEWGSWGKRARWDMEGSDDEGSDGSDMDDDDSYDFFSRPRRRRRVDRRAKSPKVVDESLVKNKIAGLLAKVEGAMGNGIFAVDGLLAQAPNTAIKLKDGTMIKFPVIQEELAGLVSKFEESRFGRGEDTVLDKNVRNSLELKPDEFTIMNNHWEKFMTDVLVPMIAKGLDLSTPFTANLYKLLLYQTGSFFQRHRDSEKEDRMFGTLVIQLPSKFQGGQLKVLHDGKTETFDFSSKSKSEEFNTYFAAFYCDCEHELTKLTDGVRICLIYNLVLTGEATAEIPKAPSTASTNPEFIALIEEWKKEQEDEGKPNKNSSKKNKSTNSGKDSKNEDEDVPEKLVYILSHQYTQKNLHYNNLKSGDMAVATMLKDLAIEANLCVMLGILEKTTNGDSCDDYGCGDGFDSSDEDCYAEKEYSTNNLSILDAAEEDVVTAMAGMKNMKKHALTTFENEIIPLNRVRALEPYNQTVEPTGNEGTKVTLQYRSAALVLLHMDNFLPLMADNTDSGLQILENFFLSKYKKWVADPKNLELKADVLKYGKGFLKKAPEVRAGYRTNTRTPAELMKLFKALLFVNDLDLFSKFINGYRSSVIAHVDKMIPELMKLSSKFGWDFVSKELLKIFQNLNDVLKSIDSLKMIMDAPDDDSIEKMQKMGICREIALIILDNMRKAERSTASPLQLTTVTKLYDVLLFVDDSALFSNFFLQKAVLVHIEKMLPQLINLGGKLSWSFVSDEVTKILRNMKDDDGMKSLGILQTIAETSKNDVAKLESCREFAKIIVHDILEREKKNANDNMMIPAARQLKFLEGFCVTANIIGADFAEFFKSRDSSVTIPFLKGLAAKTKNQLNEPWLQIAKDLAVILKEAASKILIEPDWRKRTDFSACGDSTCSDCSNMRRFLAGDDVSRMFQIKTKKGRDHLHGRLPKRDLLSEPGRIGTTGSKWTLNVTKQRNSAHLKEVEKKNLTKEHLTELNTLLAASGAPIEVLEQERVIIFLDQ